MGYKLITDLLGRALLLQSFSLGSCSILIRSTHVYGIVATESTVPRKHIRTQHTCIKPFEIQNENNREREKERQEKEFSSLHPMILPRWGTLFT